MTLQQQAPAPTRPPGRATRWWTGLSPRTRRMAPVVGTGVGALVALTYLFFNDPNEPGHFPGCPTKTLFGIDCPGCGSTRAVYALIHGNVTRAADHNIVLVMMTPFLLFWYGRWAYHSWTGRVPTVMPGSRAAKLRYWGTIALLAIVVVFGVLRNFLPYLGSGAL